MTGGLLWKFNRLRVMSAAEVGFRARRALVQKWEKGRVQNGWAPFPEQPVVPIMSLFGLEQSILKQWHSRFHLDPDVYEYYLMGEVDFFDHVPLEIGRPVQWHRDPMTGTVAPLEYGKDINYRDESLVGNIKCLWELGRHQHVIPLAVAYAVTGEKIYRTAVLEQVEGWIAQNPFAKGIHWCSALEVALRLIAWAVIHSLFALREGDGGIFAASATPVVIGRSIYQQAWFIRHYLSLFSSANNHLIGELCGLWTATTVFDLGPEGEKWREEARLGLERELLLQVHDDGVDREQAFYYHLWVLEYLLFAWLVGERSGQLFSPRFRQRIVAMNRFLRDVSPPQGVPPDIGDSDDGCVVRFDPFWPRFPYQEVMESVETVFGDSHTTCQKSFWYGAIVPPERQGTDLLSTNGREYPIVYEKGGYAILGGQCLHLIFDAGPLGYLGIAAHGHADALAFCLAVDGEWWLVDPGTYSYHDKPEWRNYFRGTAAHNTIQVADQDQSIIGGPFLWLQKAHAQLEGAGKKGEVQWCSGSHDGYDRLGLLHHRTVHMDVENQKLEIFDRLIGRAEFPVSLNFHFAPDIQVTQREEKWLASWPGKTTRLVIKPDGGEWSAVRGQEKPIMGWYSSKLGKKQPSTSLCGHYDVVLPFEMRTVIQLERMDED